MSARGPHTPRAAFGLFDSPVGPLGLAWRGERVVTLQLPGATADATRERVLGACDADEARTPSRFATGTISRILEMLTGSGDDLSDIGLDLREATPFAARVYAEARHIQPGTLATYGELARRVGSAGGARAVGGALGKNPIAIIVPCHRVISASGALGGFSAPGGLGTKTRLLELEGVPGTELTRRRR